MSTFRRRHSHSSNDIPLCHHLRTSWRSIQKNTETNDKILSLHRAWTVAHDAAIKELSDLYDRYAVFSQEALDDVTQKAHTIQETDVDIDKCMDPANDDGLYMIHWQCTLYICNENEKEYTFLGTGNLSISYNKTTDETWILFIDKGCLLVQMMNDVFTKCVYDKEKHSVDWIGYNAAKNRIKCRVLFDDTKHDQELAIKFIESYNKCWHNYCNKPVEPMLTNTNAVVPRTKYTNKPEMFKNIMNSAADEMIMKKVMVKTRISHQRASIQHMTKHYELQIILLRNEIRYNLYESDVLPRCVPIQVVVHQINSKKAMIALYNILCIKSTICEECDTCTEQNPIFDDFILHKNQNMFKNTFCVIHDEVNKNRNGIGKYCDVLEFLISRKHSKTLRGNIPCAIQTICYSKKAELCSVCCLLYILSSDGLSQMFCFIEEFIKDFKANDVMKVIKEIYGVIMVIRMLSNFLLYPLLIGYIFSFSTFYRKLFKFWISMTQFIWNFKKNKDNIKDIKFNRYLVEMIIVQINAGNFRSIDENDIALIAVNRDNVHLFELLLDLFGHILTDFIYASSKYWKKKHFKYLWNNKSFTEFLMNWFKNEFEVNHYKFGYGYLSKYHKMNDLKKYLNGTMIDRNQRRFEQLLLRAFKSIEYDAEYVLKIRRVMISYIINKSNHNNHISLQINTNLNVSWHKEKKLYLRALYLSYKGDGTSNDNENNKYCIGEHRKCVFCRKYKPIVTKLFKCSQCQFVIYCSKKCQKLDWKHLNHKWICQRLRVYTDNTRRLAMK